MIRKAEPKTTSHSGFDKPSGDENGPTCECVSEKSFGHTGFTGTLAWADPDKEIIYIFS